MRESENLKIIRDTQYFKDKSDQALLNLKHNEKALKELQGMRQFCEDVQEQEEKRLKKAWFEKI